MGKRVMLLAVKTCEAIDKCECNSLSIVECFIYLQVSACKLAINSAYFLDKKGNTLIEK